MDRQGEDITRNTVINPLAVTTPINIERLSTNLADHPDKVFVNYLIDGLRHGFHTGIHPLPDTSYECKNLNSARLQQIPTSELIDKEINKGFLSGPYDTIPFAVYRINPIGIAEGKYSKKKRVSKNSRKEFKNTKIQ